MLPIFTVVFAPLILIGGQLNRAEPALNVSVPNHFRFKNDSTWWERFDQNGFAIQREIAFRPEEAIKDLSPRPIVTSFSGAMEFLVSGAGVTDDMAQVREFQEWLDEISPRSQSLDAVWFPFESVRLGRPMTAINFKFAIDFDFESGMQWRERVNHFGFSVLQEVAIQSENALESPGSLQSAPAERPIFRDDLPPGIYEIAVLGDISDRADKAFNSRRILSTCWSEHRLFASSQREVINFYPSIGDR